MQYLVQRFSVFSKIWVVLLALLSSMAVNASSSVEAELVPLHRYWNLAIGDHFYTADKNELGNGKDGWVYEGIEGYLFNQPKNGTTPLYRYWNLVAGDHFYTTNWNELGVDKNFYRLEGIVGYVLTEQKPESKPLYRYWNPYNTDHFYTTDWTALANGRQGWGFEKVEGYLYSSPNYIDECSLPPPPPEEITEEIIYH
ncbi:hypothetical protein [Spartinivicinus ruber]|uniref:hypothetical protein n=1 Tax=Spartinivicinus ruber TaxID=2683272 RepID=UPI0013D66C29|nr:hypothetical protein [Spartinivicinus ruber]